MRNSIWVIIILSVLQSCTSHPETETDLIHLIPQKTAAILRVPKWQDLKNSLQSAKFLKSVSETRLYEELDQKRNLLNYFNPEKESYIAWIALGDDDYDLAFITEAHKNLLPKDSSFTKQLNNYDYEGVAINYLKIDDQEIYFITNDTYLLASTSKLILENAVLQANSGRDPEDISLKNILKTSSAQSPNLLINGFYYKSLFRDIFDHHRFQSSKKSFDWLAVDLDIETDAIEFSGVLQYSKDSDQNARLFEGLSPATTNFGGLIPISARGYSYFNFQDWEVYKSNLAEYRGALLKDFKLPLDDYMQYATGVGSLQQEDDVIVFSEVTDAEQAGISLQTISGEAEIFREYPIRKLNDSTLFQTAFRELLNLPALEYYIALDAHFFFAKSINQLKDLTANYQNGAVLNNDQTYKQFRKNLSDTYTLEYYTNTGKTAQYLDQKLSKEHAKGLKHIDLKTYPHAALQLSASDDYVYINGGIYETPVSQKKSQVVQIASIKLDNDLLNNPQLLKNYRTKGQNILVQDVSNTLYQINQSGKIDWKKELDGPILGAIEQVDLYKNGRLQYAFVTPHHFYVIASDGVIVQPFDINYKNTLTQPLAVFDYDGNRDYRFVIIQDNVVSMLDREGKNVKGFKYEKAEAAVNAKPQHLRIGSKDYLIFPLENGKLKILSRTGDLRVNVAEKFNFSGNPIATEKSDFVLIEADGSSVSISQSGKVTRKKSNSDTETLFDRGGSITAKLEGNVLTINNEKKELDLGIYSGLHVFTYGTSSYVALTDLQTNRVYLYDAKANLLPNFPVYAASNVDLAHSGNAKNLLLTCKGESDSVLIYQINL
ncbi:hypothetical protein [Leeuwenhoekiella parthenopeia]|uniref:Uncharacterized protein n=1 Tax=Leeuwenhoekiella parthenopeia TaxID=2890320 RepID=A0ABS8GS81_9FLAO|nr:hypothetical protein [Leeuwenhoekiella parthenopeia]MCC4212852.1 hypothetical protein [Leeuwenhoekiella parthenopeia]